MCKKQIMLYIEGTVSNDLEKFFDKKIEQQNEDLESFDLLGCFISKKNIDCNPLTGIKTTYSIHIAKIDDTRNDQSERKKDEQKKS